MNFKSLSFALIPWLIACQNPGLTVIQGHEQIASESSQKSSSVWLREPIYRQTQTPDGVIHCGEAFAQAPDAFSLSSSGVMTLLGIGEAARLPILLGVVLPDDSVGSPEMSDHQIFSRARVQGDRLIAEQQQGSKKITYIRSDLDSVRKAFTQRDECLTHVQTAAERSMFYASATEAENRILWDRSQLRLAGWNQDEISEGSFKQFIFYGALLTGSSEVIRYLQMDTPSHSGAEMMQIPEVVPRISDNRGRPGPWTPKVGFLQKIKPKAIAGGVVGGALYGLGIGFDTYIWWQGERLKNQVADVKGEIDQLMALDEEEFRAHLKENDKAHDLIQLALEQAAFDKMRQGL